MAYKFIVVYSDGPMGASVISSLIEKYGYLNLPFRKFNLYDYVMGTRLLNDHSMQYKFLEHLSSLYSNSRIGGTSVKDRNSRAKIIRAKKPSSKDIDEFLSYKPNNLNNLLTHCFIFVNKYITYKPNFLPIRGFIIQEIPKINNLSNDPYDYSYLEKLNKLNSFKCIVLNRDFKNWVASLLSQQDSNLCYFAKLKTISLEKLFNRWNSINNLQENKKLFSIKFQSIILPNTYKTNILLAKYLLNNPLNYLEIMKENFDLFGSISSFKKTFTPADKSYSNSNIILKIILHYYTYAPKKLRIILDYTFNLFRLLRLLRVS
tara:strand:+ start:6236 stop:7189 length:954 start_codon:yes stop_codon:yes gene_type:complete